FVFFFQAEDGIRDRNVTGVQTCALPILGKTSEKELQIEGLIKSKGFDDALVFLTDEDVKVIVSADELKEEDTVRILDILKSETRSEERRVGKERRSGCKSKE